MKTLWIIWNISVKINRKTKIEAILKLEDYAPPHECGISHLISAG